MTKPPRKTSGSIVRPFDGEFYTRYLSKTYDKVTTLTGWRKKIARHALKGIKPCHMLDVGCGTGYVMNIAKHKGFKIVGIDPSQGMIDKAKVNFGFTDQEILQGSSSELPFADNTFDFLLASGSMAYVMDIEKTVAEMVRVTKPGGIIRIIEHAKPKQKNLFSGFMFFFTQASGDLYHDYEHYFGSHSKLVNHETLGRGGYMQLFDFKKA